jgi:DNA polymerase III alpha subunit (gram-positive type)
MAIVDEDLKVVEELDMKLKPDGGRLPLADAGALKVNGINLNKHLEDPETTTYSEANVKIVQMIQKYFKKTGKFSNIRPLGYNLSFDIDFVQKYVIHFKEWNSLISYNEVDPKHIVSFLKDCGWLPPELGKLVSVVKYFDISMGVAHTAKADALATVEVYKKLKELMESKKNGGQSVDLIQMLEAE